MAGGVLSAVALAGTTILPAPSVADEPPMDEFPVGEFQGEADLAPFSVRPGEEVTASDSACFPGTTAIWWSLRAEGEVLPSKTGTAQLAADGSWELTFAAPREPGDWLWFAVCLPPNVAAPDALSTHIDEISTEGPDVELMEAWGVDGYLYYAHLLEVVAPSGPTTTVPGPTTTTTTTTTAPGGPAPTVPVLAPAPPAAPVPGEPAFAG
jgi:hypothetical protein